MNEHNVQEGGVVGSDVAAGADTTVESAVVANVEESPVAPLVETGEVSPDEEVVVDRETELRDAANASLGQEPQAYQPRPADGQPV